jgi:hypothetical protein
MKGENINLLNEQEWREIHNALSLVQSLTGDIAHLDPNYVFRRRHALQQLMDKVRDNYIAPYDQTTPQT